MKICINKLRLFGYHGLKKVEKESGQYFDISIDLISSESLYGDEMPVIDYEKVMLDTENIFSKKRYNLLESLISDLDKEFKSKYSLCHIKIKITKSSAPLEHDCESVGVEYIWNKCE
tara:strand:+ start:180 stop:530 length:351 start_codon:yes stop_codon:yes gene_type:complete